ncbi:MULTISPECIES: hypothetical protein [unclassified Streptomyces]|uniref:hypothetical protein n=1 Tax=unclassified Streptomyces TaxID=2593676 RepID=UPI003250AF1C
MTLYDGHDPVPTWRSPIDLTSLFSAPEGASGCATAVSPPPTTNPFQAPDFGEDETFPVEDAQEPFTGTGAARRKAG